MSQEEARLDDMFRTRLSSCAHSYWTQRKDSCKISQSIKLERGKRNDILRIQEFIVVEGKDDTIAVQRAVDADTIETNGSAISEETLRRIAHAQQLRGVIVFTDPDYPGRRIRAIIEQAVPDVKHAFLAKRKAIAKNGKKVGIEHASDEDIREALANVYTTTTTMLVEEITREDLMYAKLIGHPSAKARRDRLGDILNIGATNGKQLHKRLQMFKITVEQFVEAMHIIEQEEQNV